MFCRSPTLFCDLHPAHPVLPDFVEVSGPARASYVSDLHLQIGYGPAWASARLASRGLPDPGSCTVRTPAEGSIVLCGPESAEPPEDLSRGAVTQQQVTTGFYRLLEVTKGHFILLKVNIRYYMLLEATTSYYPGPFYNHLPGVPFKEYPPPHHHHHQGTSRW